MKVSVLALALFVAACGLICYGQEPTRPEPYLEKLQNAQLEASRGNLSAAVADSQAAILLDPKQAAGWYELGSVLAQSANFRGAEDAFRHAIQLQPELAKAHFSLALTLIANPANKLDWPGAISECREALKYQPNYPEALNLLGSGLMTSGETEEAIKMFRRAIELAPGSAEAHFNLALALDGKDNFEEAGAEYRAAIAAKNNYPEASSSFGKMLLRQGKTGEAEIEVKAALCLNPDLTETHYTFAQILRAQNSAEAQVEFAEAKDLLNRQPNGVRSSELSNQGLGLAAQGDRAGAIATLRKAIALRPDYGVPHYNLGLVLADSGDLAGAIEELNKAASLMPGEATVWFNRGRVLLAGGDRNGALETISWAAHIAPNDAKIALQLSELQPDGKTRLDRPAESAALRQPRAGAVADTAAAHFDFANELMVKRDFQGAIGELLRVLALEPSMLDARRKLALALIELKEDQRAELELDKILQCAPDDAKAETTLGEVLLNRGDVKRALEQLRLALKHDPKSATAQAAMARAEKAAQKH